MARTSTGVIAVGPIGPSAASERTPREPAAVGADALLSAVGASVVGVQAAICSAIPAEVQVEYIRRITRIGFDLSRVRLASEAEAVSRPRLEPVPEQLANVNPGWSVHILPITPGRQRQLLRTLFQRVALVSVDTSYGPEIGPIDWHDILELIPYCDVILSSSNELGRLWPRESARDVLRLLAREGARAAVIRLGEAGSIGILEDTITWMPPLPIRTTARWPGRDAYAGAFAATFAPDRDMAHAMAWATSAAAAVIASESPLELVNEFARRSVASKAKLLQKEAERG